MPMRWKLVRWWLLDRKDELRAWREKWARRALVKWLDKVEKRWETKR